WGTTPLPIALSCLDRGSLFGETRSGTSVTQPSGRPISHSANPAVRRRPPRGPSSVGMGAWRPTKASCRRMAGSYSTQSWARSSPSGAGRRWLTSSSSVGPCPPALRLSGCWAAPFRPRFAVGVLKRRATSLRGRAFFPCRFEAPDFQSRAVGVGRYCEPEPTGSVVGESNIGSSYSRPEQVIPDFGQVFGDNGESPSADCCHVFQEDETGSKYPNCFTDVLPDS